MRPCASYSKRRRRPPASRIFVDALVIQRVVMRDQIARFAVGVRSELPEVLAQTVEAADRAHATADIGQPDRRVVAIADAGQLGRLVVREGMSQTVAPAAGVQAVACASQNIGLTAAVRVAHDDRLRVWTGHRQMLGGYLDRIAHRDRRQGHCAALRVEEGQRAVALLDGHVERAAPACAEGACVIRIEARPVQARPDDWHDPVHDEIRLFKVLVAGRVVDRPPALAVERAVAGRGQVACLGFRRAPCIDLAVGCTVIVNAAVCFHRLAHPVLRAPGTDRVTLRLGVRAHLQRLDRLNTARFQSAVLAKRNREGRVVPVVCEVITETHLLAFLTGVAHKPDAAAPGQVGNKREVILAPLHDEAALRVGPVERERIAGLNPVEAVLPQNLLDDLGVALIKKEAALWSVTQQREPRFEHDLIDRLVAVALQQREAGGDALNAPLRFGPTPRCGGRRLDHKCSGPVQEIGARKIMAGMGEADRVAGRRADGALPVKGKDVSQCRGGRRLHVETVELVRVDARACDGGGR